MGPQRRPDAEQILVRVFIGNDNKPRPQAQEPAVRRSMRPEASVSTTRPSKGRHSLAFTLGSTGRGAVRRHHATQKRLAAYLYRDGGLPARFSRASGVPKTARNQPLVPRATAP